MQGILFFHWQHISFHFLTMDLKFESLFQVIAADAANVMSSCYGSHVLRTLLCLCKGVPSESLQDFHTTKRSTVLAERLSCVTNQPSGHVPKNFENGFSGMFRSFVREMLHNAKADIATLRVDKNSSLVLQVSIIEWNIFLDFGY